MTARYIWTAERVQQLRELYPDNPAAVVAEQIGGTVKSVYQKAGALGIQKSPDYWERLREAARQLANTSPAAIAKRFTKGLVPWNKGKPGSTGLHPNCRATQFKPRPPQNARNYVPIGHLRVTKDGYLERKVTDNQSIAPARRWVAEHRLVWEATQGPIPAGHIVIFKPGTKTTVLDDITLEKLECITRAENARRNHPRNKSPELARLVQLQGCITRQVNRIGREAQERAQA